MAKGLQKLEHRYPDGKVVDLGTDACLVSEKHGCREDVASS